MTLHATLAELEALGTEKVRMRYSKNGAGENQYGVKLGDIRKVAKELKTNHGLALLLWGSGNVEARLLTTLVCEPTNLSADELDAMVRSLTWSQESDWLNAYVVQKHPEKESLREGWMDSENPWAARAGWSLTARRVSRSTSKRCWIASSPRWGMRPRKRNGR